MSAQLASGQASSHEPLQRRNAIGTPGQVGHAKTEALHETWRHVSSVVWAPDKSPSPMRPPRAFARSLCARRVSLETDRASRLVTSAGGPELTRRTAQL